MYENRDVVTRTVFDKFPFEIELILEEFFFNFCDLNLTRLKSLMVETCFIYKLIKKHVHKEIEKIETLNRVRATK
eukprot:snap_masked-scaffold_11-processed-gene-9.4-mRNA-1 protein AED:1.00 eAED:1.00 QI:0/-1/0/0/-1/1/1/0/74